MNLEEISLMLFEIYHEQNKWDSVDNAIEHALKNAGNDFQFSQVTSIRPSKPYIVTQMQFSDFVDFKSKNH